MRTRSALLKWTEDFPRTLPEPTIELEGIALLKRSCVRLLGIITFEQKEGQDRLREAGGLTLLLGLCQINDSNPSTFSRPFLRISFYALAEKVGFF